LLIVDRYPYPKSVERSGVKPADTGPALNSTGVRLIPIRKANMQLHEWFIDALELREYRHTIETVNSQLEKTGVEPFHARTNSVHASSIRNSRPPVGCSG
jgi:hypothetical protein